MSITYLQRITGSTNSLVQLDTTDTTAVALSANYITAQAANIAALTEGGWIWEQDDLIIVSASDGVSLAVINSTFTSLNSIASSSSSFAIQMSTFSLTNAQWTSMSTTPVLILPGQGLGTIILPELVTLELVYGTVALATGGLVLFEYGAITGGAGVQATNTQQATDFYATANTLYNFRLSVGNSTQKAKSIANNVGIYISNTSANFTGGTGNVYNGVIYYRTVPIV